MVSFVVLLSIAPGTTQPTPASALSGSEFNANRIIDDLVFYSPNPTMTPDEIQRFLNSKVPNCDTNGIQKYSGSTTRASYSATKGVSPPFTCLKDYAEDTPIRSGETGLCAGFNGGRLSAALIIHRVADSCGVSAKVIIVMLQKEQSLITDDWPWPNQYRSAMGYGCPDTAPCDSQYYGFFNQVYQAARQLKRYAASPNLFNYAVGRTSYVQYQANAPQCGGTHLTPQTAATAALYNYTPYQPNPAALNNLYGTGDGCSAYGNRNFWRLYQDWFGSTLSNDTAVPHPNGTVITDGQKVYLLENGVRRHISGPWVLFSYRFQWKDIVESSTGDRLLPVGQPLTALAPGTLIYATNSPLYVVNYESGTLKKQHVPLATFNAFNYNWSDVLNVPQSYIDSLPTQSSALQPTAHPAGSLVLSPSDSKIYFIGSEVKHYIPGPLVFASQRFSWDKVTPATTADLALPTSTDVGLYDGAMVIASGIFLIQKDSQGYLKKPVGPWECFANKLNYDLDNLVPSQHGLLPARTGSTFTC